MSREIFVQLSRTEKIKSRAKSSRLKLNMVKKINQLNEEREKNDTSFHVLLDLKLATHLSTVAHYFLKGIA